MRHVVAILFVASLGACAMVAFAATHENTYSQEYGKTMSQLVLNQTSVISGLVIETQRGLAITSNRGTLLLKGLNISKFVGENVKVTGVIRGESFFAVRVLPAI